MSNSDRKRAAAAAALEYVGDGIALGVGTGSTVDHFIELLDGVRDKLTSVVSSSKASTRKLEAKGFTVSELNSVGDLDLYVDGADEVTKHFDLLKGGGGALTREKVLAACARKFVCIADDSKLVGVLGKYPLPVEVIPMAQSFIARQFIKMRGQPIWREDFVTDNGNHVLDVHNLSLLNPREMETRINQIPGVVTVGIFAHRGADVILLGKQGGGVDTLVR
jgi:ribose 5-phosphate isomerase A